VIRSVASTNNPDIVVRGRALCALLAILVWAAPYRTADAEIVDRIIATVNDDVITLSDFYTTAAIFVQLNQVQPAALASVDGRRFVAARVMQELINRTLLGQQADQHQLSVERASVDGFIERMARQSGGTVEQLREQLRSQDIRYEDFYDYIRMELTKLRVVNVMVTSGISVSDAEVDSAFSERYPEGAVEMRYDVSQILIAVGRNATPEETEGLRQEAEALRQEIVDGGDFEALAEARSDDASRREGGHLGDYARGELPRDFEDHALRLLPGELSEVFQTRFGFHIVRLNDRREVPTIDVDTVREELYREIQDEKTNRELERFMAELHEDSIVQVLFDPTALF